jgi:hypothetical protein
MVTEGYVNENFTTDQAAPLDDPRTSEPGPGQLDVLDSGPRWSIAASVLEGAAGATANGNPGIWDFSPRAPVRGLACLFKAAKLYTNASSQNLSMGFDSDKLASPDTNLILAFVQNKFQVRSIQVILNLTNGLAHTGAIVLRGRGAFYLALPNGATDWELIIVTPDTVWPANNYATFSKRSTTTGQVSLDSFKVARLGDPWRDDYFAASQRILNPVLNDSFVHAANGTMTFRVTTLPTAGTISMNFRQQDALNTWRVTIDANGRVKLYTVTADVPTEQWDYGTWAAPMYITIHLYDNRVSALVQDNFGNTSATVVNAAFQTETDMSLISLGTGGEIVDVSFYPRTISAAAAAVLNAWLAT